MRDAIRSWTGQLLMSWQKHNESDYVLGQDSIPKWHLSTAQTPGGRVVLGVDRDGQSALENSHLTTRPHLPPVLTTGS